MARRQLPRDRRPPIVPHEVESPRPGSIGKSKHVGGERAHPIVPTALGTRTWGIAALIRSQHPETSVGETGGHT